MVWRNNPTVSVAIRERRTLHLAVIIGKIILAIPTLLNWPNEAALSINRIFITSGATASWAASHRACGYDPSDAAMGGHAPIRCRNATIFPK